MTTTDTEPRAEVHFYLPNFSGGGAERIFIRLVNHLTAQGREVTLIVNTEKGPLRPLLNDGVALKVLDAPKAFQAIPKLARHLRATRPTALISALTRTNIAALMAAKLAGGGLRVIVCERNTFSVFIQTLAPARRILINRLVKWLYPQADVVLGNTAAVAADIEHSARLEGAKVGVINNPAPDKDQIDMARTAPNPHPWLVDSKPVAVAIGRLVPQKDYPTMLSAVAQSGSDLRLLVLGEGPDLEPLTALTTKLGISDRVQFLGFQMDRFAYLVAADLFLISSITEGFPNALIEAVAAGVPCVSTDCAGGGAREIMGETLSNWIVPVGDSAAMADVITSILSVQDEDTQMVQRARISKLADQFHIDQIANAFLKRALP